MSHSTADAAVTDEATDGTAAAATGGALPTLVIIGAQKCGTSALNTYLNLHPQAGMSTPKELNFFVAERTWDRGLDWYRSHFDPALPVRGDTSPNYSAVQHFSGVAERMARTVPDAKIIYLVRDPVARIAAHFVHNWAHDRERRSPVEALGNRGNLYVGRSLYMHQLDEYLARYAEDRILVLDQRDLLERRVETLRTVFRWLGIDDTFRHPGFEQKVHVTADFRRPGPPPEPQPVDPRLAAVLPGRVVRRLERRNRRKARKQPMPPPDVAGALPADALDALHQDAQRLRAFTGRPFAHWTV